MDANTLEPDTADQLAVTPETTLQDLLDAGYQPGSEELGDALRAVNQFKQAKKEA